MLLISQQPLKATLQHQFDGETMPDLDIDHGIAQPAQLIEEAFKFVLQREVGFNMISLPMRRQIQPDRLHDARFWFIARQPALNRKALDDTKAQSLDDFNSPALAGT